MEPAPEQRASAPIPAAGPRENGRASSKEIARARGFSDLFAAITSCCPYAVVVHRAGEIIYANAAAVHLAGCRDADQLVGKMLDDVYALSPRDAGRAADESAGSNILRRRRAVLTLPDGRAMHVDIEALEVMHQGRRVSRWLIRSTDHEMETLETLQQTEALLRSVMESSADYILSVAPDDGRILYLNRTTATGKSPADYVGTSIYALLDEPSRKALAQCVQQVRMTRATSSCELTFEHPERGLRFYDVSVSPVIRGAHIRSLTINSRDVTARKHAEQTLRDREQKLRILIEQLPAILWTTNRDLVFTSCRGAGIRALRLRLDQIIGESVAQFLATGSADSPILQHHFAALHGQSIDFETDWKQRCYQVHLEPLRDVESTIVGVMGLAVDVTRIKRTSEALHRAHERLELVTASISDGLWSVRWDPERGYYDHYHSPVMERITGRPFSFFRNCPERWLGTVHRDDRVRVGVWFEQLHRQLDQNDPTPHAGREELQEQEYRILLPDGTVRWIRDSVIARPLANGGTHLHGVVADITARRNAEQLTRQHQEELAHAGRLSTMGELVAGIAHEINQPLYAITNYAAACRNMLSDPDQTRLDRVLQWTEEIGMQAERVAYIISRLANFVRKTTTKASVIRVDDLIDDSLNLLTFDLRAQSVQVEKTMTKPAPRVHGNEIELQQVMVNLLRNACDAMIDVPASDRRLMIRTEQLDRRVRVHIQDVGHGFGDVPPNRVFEPFFTTKSRGMGLGLAISRSIIEASDGKLWATPNAGPGATFHFELPVWREGE